MILGLILLNKVLNTNTVNRKNMIKKKYLNKDPKDCRSKLYDNESNNFDDVKSLSDWFKTSRSSIKNPIQDSRFKRRNQEVTSQDFI